MSIRIELSKDDLEPLKDTITDVTFYYLIEKHKCQVQKSNEIAEELSEEIMKKIDMYEIIL
jgi:hypothetical protein